MTTKLEILLTAKNATDGAFKSVGKEIGDLQSRAAGLGSALTRLAPALAGAFSVSVLTSFVKRTIDGIDALNDLSDATGASIENLSALEDVAARTGTSFETVGAAVIAMNKALGNSKPGDDVAKSLNAIGLEVETLKELDPAEAFRQIAVALSKFADDGNKARLVGEIFKKNLAEISPLLKDVATQTKLVGTVTTEQAKAAEAFNIQLFNLQKNATDAARALAGPMVSAINETIAKFKEGSDAGRGFFETLRNEQLRLLGLGGGAPGSRKSSGIVQNEFAGLGTFATENRGFLPSVGDLGGGSGGKAGKPGKAAAIAELSAIRDATAEQKALFLRSERESYGDIDKALKAALGNAGELGTAIVDSGEAMKQAFLQSEKAAYDFTEAIVEASTYAEEAARNIQDALGDTLVKTLKGDFDSIADLWLDMLTRMAAEAAAAQLSRALFGEGFGKTTNDMGGYVGDFLKMLGSSEFGGARASGGPISAGKAYLVGERGPELIVPGSSGTVIPNGAGFSSTIVVQGDASANTLRLIRQSQAQMAAQMRYRERF